jgi:Fe2+ transport system protein FeoA
MAVNKRDLKHRTQRVTIFALYLDFIQIMISGRPATEMQPNEGGRIIRFEDMVIAGKLMSMGIMPHAQIEMIRRNALGHTLIFRINNRFKIALRRDEAKTIMVDGI